MYFELLSDNVAYVALGLSRNNIMGDDSVMECIVQNGIVLPYSSWNTAQGNMRDGVVSSFKIYFIRTKWMSCMILIEQSINSHD